MDNDKYANKLDRFINEMLEKINITDSSGKELGPDHYRYSRDSLVCEFDLSKQSIHTITDGEKLVYRCVNGHTEVCRPGDWVVRMAEWYLDCYRSDWIEEVRGAVQQATERNVAFTPVCSHAAGSVSPTPVGRPL